ncbi:MAG TPA: DNA polymerase III subunit delta [Calditrichia bacterium]|nr:DNA polymerase III subunit delta [Calditrichia bacterium]
MAGNNVNYYSDISRSVKKGELAAVYFLYGEEIYLMDTLIEQMSKAFVGKAEKEENYFLRYAPDAGIEDIIALTAGSSLFSEKKVIVYKDFQLTRNPNMDRMKRYLERPDKDILLIVMARVDNVNQARYNVFKDLATVVNLLPLREKELKTFITGAFREFGQDISEEGIRTLLYLVGEKIHDLKSEIAQVANRFPEKKAIDAEEIEAVVGIYVTQTVFELAGAIAAKDLDKSLFLMHNLLERGESPGSILFFLLRHLLMLWKIRGYYQSGEKNERTIQQRLRIYPRQFAQYLKELPNWKMNQLQQAMQLMGECDRSLRNSQLPSEVLLDSLILKLIRPN